MDSAKLAKEREAALQGQTFDPEQAKAETEKRIQQLPPELQALIRDRSRWMLEQLKKARQQRTGPSNCVVSKRNEERR